MELKLSAQKAGQKIVEGEGGSYYGWSSSEFPLLKVGAGILTLQSRGFAIPHFADSSKIGYVLQGSGGMFGMIFPNTTEEKVFNIQKGEAILVPIGVVSWWYNNGDSELVVVFMGETSTAYVPGEFTYFILTGGHGILPGFSTEFVSKAYDMDENEANKLAKSQTGVMIIKLEQGKSMPQACNINNNDIVNNLVFDIDSAVPDINVKGGGLVTTLTAAKLPMLREMALSANLEKLDSNAMSSPILYARDSAVQVIYVARGSGRIQIVGINGKHALDTKVQPGYLFVVPRYFAVAKIADEEGMECFSVLTTSEPEIEQLAGKRSVWKALSPVVLQASLNVTPEFVDQFVTKISESSVLIPSSKELDH